MPSRRTRAGRVRALADAVGDQLVQEQLEVELGVVVRRIETHRRLEVADALVDGCRSDGAGLRRVGEGEDAEKVVRLRGERVIVALRELGELGLELAPRPRLGQAVVVATAGSLDGREALLGAAKPNWEREAEQVACGVGGEQ